MQTKLFSFSLWISFLVLFFSARAGYGQSFTVKTDHQDANYNIGETVNFLIQSNVTGPATYKITRGKYTSELAGGTVNLVAGQTAVVSYTSTGAENLHIEVSSNFGFGQATAMVGRDEMVPFVSEPSDFDSFWAGVKAQLAAVPVNPQITPYTSTNYSTSYQISLGNIDGRKVYGMLTVPNGPGPFPVLLKLPPYGSFPIQPETQFAERTNAITLSITIHNAPATTTDPNAYQPDDPTDPNTIYYKYGITAGIRAIDYLTSRPDFNGTDVAITGVSQGAGLAMMVAALDSRVKLLLIGTPIFCNQHGELYDHPSGFPFYLHLPLQSGNQQDIDAVSNAIQYYEAAFAAKRFKGPVFLLTSYNDQVTVAETQFIASNLFDGQKVILHNIPGGHDNRPNEYLAGRFDVMRRYFPASNNPPFPWASTGKGYMADAGPDQTTSTGTPVTLTGTIEKNDQTNPASIPVEWRKISGPGTVTFSAPNAHSTNATFSQDGTYVLEFRGTDKEKLQSQGLFYTISDRVVVTVGNGGGGGSAPTVSLSTPNTNVSGPFTVNASFSEPVTGLALSDFVISNGNASSLSGSGSSYSFTVTPASAGTVTIQLPAGAATNSAGQGNLASNTLTVNYSPVQGGQKIDLELNLTADATTVDLYSPVTFTLTLTNTSSVTAHNIGVSFKLPQGFGLLLSYASAGMYNSWLGDWTLNELAAGASATVTVKANLNIPNPAPYYAQVTAAQEEDVDSSPNNNPGPVPVEDDEAAVSVQASGGGGNTPPSVVLSTNSGTVSGAFDVNVVFSEAVTGLALSDFNVTNGSATALTGGGATYTLTVNPSASGNVSVSLPAGQAQSAASGLANTASNTLTVFYQPGNGGGSYCEPYATPWHEWIKRVKFGSIDKYSQKEGYADFTALSTDVSQGGTYPITIELGHGYWIYNEYYRVWIDFNQDGDFDDAGELCVDQYVPAQANGTNPPPVNATISIPANATAGTTRMRVSLHRDQAATPCGNWGFGEYEDYSVNITTGDVPPAQGYCASQSTPWHEWIRRVKIGSIDKYSEKEGYADFTSLSTELALGTSHFIIIELGHGYWIYDEYYRVWIDFNQDGDFDDPGELCMSQFVPAVANGTNPPPVYGQVVVPDNVITGETRMRVSMHRDSYGMACNQGGFGEVEDYTVKIVQGGSGPVTYCQPQVTPWHEWIQRFKMGQIDNYSSKEGYGDFTNLSTVVSVNQPTQFMIQLGHGYWIYDENYRIWADLNKDGDFTDAGELLFDLFVPAVANGTNPSPVFGSIIIPGDTPAGDVRLRVSLYRDTKGQSPCEQTGFGEYEDYTLQVVPATGGMQDRGLLDFSAIRHLDGVKTQWVLDPSTPADHSLVLEKMVNGQFEKLSGFEISNSNLYEYRDDFPQGGMNFYRLSVLNQEGEVVNSRIASVLMPAGKQPPAHEDIVFPTLTHDEVFLKVDGFMGRDITISVYSLTGGLVMQKDFEAVQQGLVRLSFSGFGESWYIVRITDSTGKALTGRFYLLR